SIGFRSRSAAAARLCSWSARSSHTIPREDFSRVAESLEAAHENPDQGRIEELTNRVEWDTRIFEERRKTMNFVCEVPVLIEQRLFALALQSNNRSSESAAGTQDLSGNRILGDGSIVVVEERHTEAQQQLVDGGLVLPNGAIELAFPLLIGVPHAHGNAIGEARTRRLLDQWHDGCRRGRLPGVIAGHRAPEDSRVD